MNGKQVDQTVDEFVKQLAGDVVTQVMAGVDFKKSDAGKTGAEADADKNLQKKEEKPPAEEPKAEYITKAEFATGMASIQEAIQKSIEKALGEIQKSEVKPGGDKTIEKNEKIDPLKDIVAIVEQAISKAIKDNNAPDEPLRKSFAIVDNRLVKGDAVGADVATLNPEDVTAEQYNALNHDDRLSLLDSFISTRSR